MILEREQILRLHLRLIKWVNPLTIDKVEVLIEPLWLVDGRADYMHFVPFDSIELIVLIPP